MSFDPKWLRMTTSGGMSPSRTRKRRGSPVHRTRSTAKRRVKTVATIGSCEVKAKARA
jgi:hypothetical protein